MPTESILIKALDKPFRPLPVRLMNSIGRGLQAVGIEAVSLQREVLLAKAVKKAGCDDFGDRHFIEGLDRYLAALEQEAQLTLLGRLMAQGSIVNDLANRLQVIDWRKKHPAIAEQPIRKPLFIIGLPRTGTTILHALLDVDPANRSPLFWEVAYPVPPAAPASWTTDPRIAEDQKGLDQLFQLCPGFQAVHPMGATMPQECVAIFGMEMLAESFHATFNVPSYAEWLDDQPMARAYTFHKQFLQHLQSGGVTGERWLLKSPCHLHTMPALFETYPDANVIHTHRNPVDVCLSISSLMAMLRGVGSDAIDLKAIGRQQILWWEKLLARAVQQRKQLAATHSAQFFDLKMSETVADPLGAVERLYDHFGYELTPAVKQAMAQYMKDHARDKHGSHTYHAGDFGIDPVRDRERFAEYCEYFDV